MSEAACTEATRHGAGAIPAVVLEIIECAADDNAMRRALPRMLDHEESWPLGSGV
jgi:hypothetical protein